MDRIRQNLPKRLNTKNNADNFHRKSLVIWYMLHSILNIATLTIRHSLYLWEGLLLRMLSIQNSLDCGSVTSMNQGAIWGPTDLNMQTIQCVANSDWYAVLYSVPESTIKTLSIAEQNWANNGFFAWLLKQKESKKKLRKMNQSETGVFFFFRGTLSNTAWGKDF